MKKKQSINYMIGVAVLSLGLGSAGYADTYELTDNMPSSGSWDSLGSWHNVVGGANPASILPTDDFDMAGFILRSPTTASPTFNGGSLTSAGANGLMLFKHTGTATISNLTDTAGMVLINGNGGTQSVRLVNYTLGVWSRLSANSGQGLDVQFEGLSGSGTLRTGDATSQIGYYGLTVTGASGFSGKIQSVFGTTDWKNDADLSGATYEIVTAGYEDVILNSD
ncbi:MAG: hypothetical protein U9P12_00140, partial [Verrucomicrobiota bacterium]|nr:hypothetical protein [Verrucomicrobiota bacterium]